MFERNFIDHRSFTQATVEAPIFPEKPAPSEAELEARRQADRIRLGELRRMFGWSVEAVDQAIAGHKFPKPIGRTVERQGIGEPIYSRAAIAEWHAGFVAFGKTVPTKLR